MADTGDPRIRLDVAEKIATVTIARPDKNNALDVAMIAALERAAYLIDADGSIHAAVITGEGDKSFCAGGDIAAWSALSPEDFALQWIRQGHRAFDALARLRQPLIAALNGHTLGGGLELAATADLRIAGEHIRLGLPETGLGVIPGWSGSQRAVRRFGPRTVRRMALFGETFAASEGLLLGIVDRVVPRGQELAAALAAAQRLFERAPFATAALKMLVNAAEGEELERPLEALGSLAAASHPQLREGVAAFREKRKPKF